MCLGIPMRVETAAPGKAVCVGREGRRAISTLLVGDCAPGDWLLTFLDDARERISADRAAEVDAVLDMLEMALGGTVPGQDSAGTPFVLPSSLGPGGGTAFFAPSEPFQPSEPSVSPLKALHDD